MKQFYNQFFCRSPLTTFRHKRIRILIVFCATCLLTITGYSYSISQPTKTIALHLENVTVRQALREIERQTNYNFVVNHNKLQILNKTVTITITDDKIENILNLLLEGTNVTYVIRKRQITLIPPPKTSMA